MKPSRKDLRYARDRSRDRRGYLSGARGGPTSRGPRGGLASLVGPRKKTRDNRGTGTTHAESLTSQADTRTMDGLVQNPNKRPGTDLRKFYRPRHTDTPSTRVSPDPFLRDPLQLEVKIIIYSEDEGGTSSYERKLEQKNSFYSSTVLCSLFFSTACILSTFALPFPLTLESNLISNPPKNDARIKKEKKKKKKHAIAQRDSSLTPE